MAILTAGYASLALTLQEAASELSNNDVCARLRDALREMCKGTDQWSYYIDHFGDAESGDVIYSCNGDTYRAPYMIAMLGAKASCTIDGEKAIDVVPRTIWEEEAEDEDHYVAMEAAKLYTSKTEFPLYERFIAKDERKAAGRDSFAGKGKSFPILKPADVMAAVRSIGRAGSDNYDAGTLKRNIIKIAKAKGWGKELPKAWRGDEETAATESATAQPGTLKLIESAATCEDIPLTEAARSDYEIKLIAPGKGATAYYPPEVLKRDGPSAFPAETKVYLNHPTASQESEGPGNRDVLRLAAVTTGPAAWKESHPMGPGLYTRMKVFADHATMLEEKAPYLAMSIMANGAQLVEAGKKVFKEGLPVLAAITKGESVDIIPVPGAGGMILTEAARAAQSQQEVSEVDAAELTSLKESLALREANEKKLLERAIRGDAREFVERELKPLTLHEAGKDLVRESVLRTVPIKDGSLDEAVLKESIAAEAKRVGAAIAAATGAGRVVGMGAAPVQLSEADAAKQKADKEMRLQESIRSYRDMEMPEEAAKRAAMRGAA